MEKTQTFVATPSLKEAANWRSGSKEDDALYAAAAAAWQAASLSADLGGYEDSMGQADPAPLIVEGALYSHKDLDTKKEGGLLDRDYRKKQKAYTVFLKWGVLSQWI
jgi:hypothetical protein